MFLVTWPLRDVALVYWLRGRAAYQEQGVRILKGKPTRFSTGELVPDLPDIVTGASAFFRGHVYRHHARHFHEASLRSVSQTQ